MSTKRKATQPKNISKNDVKGAKSDAVTKVVKEAKEKARERESKIKTNFK